MPVTVLERASAPPPSEISAAVYHAPPVFVFGSNLSGRHGAGAALWARQYRGAIYGQGIGLQGNSYGIPTKDERLRTLELHRINIYVLDFIAFARSRPGLMFFVTPIGCGLAGYQPEQIAPMFTDAPPNVIMCPEFEAVLGRESKPFPLQEHRGHG